MFGRDNVVGVIAVLTFFHQQIHVKEEQNEKTPRIKVTMKVGDVNLIIRGLIIGQVKCNGKNDQNLAIQS